MAVDARSAQRMLVWIDQGVAKDDAPLPLNREESEMWDRLEVQVAEIKARGQAVEIPDMEVPDVEIPNAE